MTERIQKLREQSLCATPKISLERALLLTEFYKSGEADRVSVPVARALAFKHILTNKNICINEGELIVGERGPAPKETPTYPELCTHSLNDFEILDSRPKVFFKVNDTTRQNQESEIIPYWQGRSIRDRIFAEVDEEWKEAYHAGIFTEFMEQRAPGHTVLDGKIYKKGMLDFQNDIRESISRLDFLNDPEALSKRDELTAMDIAADSIILYAERHSDMLRYLAKSETDSNRKQELEQMAKTCSRVPAYAPQNFWEALQYYWFIHLGVITELNTWDSFNPGRLDQHLYPFYKQGIEDGSLTEERAKEILQSFWIKFNNQPAPPKVGVTAQESNTYTDFCLINLGGLDENGNDAVNDMTFMLLDVIEEMRLLQPSSMVQISKKNPDRLIKRALKIIKTGYGQPSLFNTDAIIQEMLRQGKNLIDARCGGASGCVETGAFGKESYILTGYFNLVKILELTLNNGMDPNTGKHIGLQKEGLTLALSEGEGTATNHSQGEGRIPDTSYQTSIYSKGEDAFKTFEELYKFFERQLNYFIDIKIKGNRIIERLYAEILPSPFLSILVDDCIKNGKDYNDGGARYNSSYIQGVGIGSLTDSLVSIKYNVFDVKKYTMSEVLSALNNNFVDNDDMLISFLRNTPKYGNDNDYADEVLKQIFESYFNVIDGRPNTKGGHYRINLLPTTCHVYFGSVTGATPDGRKAKEPLSEGISPVQGADVNGPTAVIKSAAKIDHLRTGGTLLNQKFTPLFLETQDGLDKLTHLIKTYFRMDGHHIQFNVVSAEVLREAQKAPEKYRDLIVRVAGYSDYFVDLIPELQEEIIKRTEQFLEVPFI